MAIIRHPSGKLQRRRIRHDGWTLARRTIFLDELANSANIRRAAAAVGMTETGARALRRRDAEFSMLWTKAQDEGVERLEQEVLAHSLRQVTSEDNPGEDRGGRTVESFDVKAALDYLKWRAARAVSGGSAKAVAVTPEAVDAALMERLEELSKRLPSS